MPEATASPVSTPVCLTIYSILYPLKKFYSAPNLIMVVVW
jgi:hypothetical protein